MQRKQYREYTSRNKNLIGERHSLYGHEPFQHIQGDFLEGLPETKRGNTAVLINVDTFSKYVDLQAVKEKTSETIRRGLYELSSRFGGAVPLTYTSDGAASFQAKIVENMLTWHEIDHNVTHPHRPQSHGTVERMNREVIEIIKQSLYENADVYSKEWDEFLPAVMRIINNMRSNATGLSPVEVIYNREPFTDVQILQDSMIEHRNVDDFCRKQTECLSRILTYVNKRLDDNAIKNRELSMDKELWTNLEIGSYVLAINRPSDVTLSKVSLPWKGPYKVYGSERPDFYKVKDLVQDIDEIKHRTELVPVEMNLTEVEARREAAKDGNQEVFITGVNSHRGTTRKLGQLEFECEVEGYSRPIWFLFRDCKFVKVVQDYCLEHDDLRSLRCKWHSEETRLRKNNRRLMDDFDTN